MKKVNGTKHNIPEGEKIEIRLRSGVQLPGWLFCLHKDQSLASKRIGDCTLSQIFGAPDVYQALIRQLSEERDRAIELRESIFKINQEIPKTSH